MAEPPPDPQQRLAPAVRGAWILTGIGISAGAGAAAAAILPPVSEIDGLPGWVVPLIVAALILGAIALIVVVPILRYRTWRFAIREDEIDLLHGAIIRTRTIVPMARVQHVETERGLLASLLDLATVKVHTAAGTHEIPGLEDGHAAQLRTEIAQRARVVDEV